MSVYFSRVPTWIHYVQIQSIKFVHIEQLKNRGNEVESALSVFNDAFKCAFHSQEDFQVWIFLF